MIYFSVPSVSHDLVSLLIRIVLSLAFLREVRIKATNIRKFAKADGLPLPLAWFVTIAELAAALSFISGILTQAAAIGVMLLMLSTISLHILKWHSPYPASKGGWEYDLMLLTLASVLLVYGAGSFTLG